MAAFGHIRSVTVCVSHDALGQTVRIAAVGRHGLVAANVKSTVITNGPSSRGSFRRTLGKVGGASRNRGAFLAALSKLKHHLSGT